MRRRSLNGQQFNLENQGRVGWNRAGISRFPVRKFGWNRESGFVADTHGSHSFIPTLDNLPGAENERERFISVHGTVEFCAVGQPPCVMDSDGVAGFW